MNFDRPPVSPVTPEKEKPKNRIRELLSDGIVTPEGISVEEGRVREQSRLDGLQKSLPEHIRTKRADEILNYFVLLRQLRDRCEEEWVEQNNARLGGYSTLTNAQFAERRRYTDSVETKRLDAMLESWVADYESLLETEKDEAERQELIDLIDAARKLQSDMANW